MKNLPKSQLFSFLSILFLSIMLVGYSPQDKHPANENPQKSKSLIKTPAPDHLYQPGTIVFKVKHGIQFDVPQETTVWFNIGSLDQLSDQYDVTGLEKRFRHRPIPENSGLPDLSRIYRLTFSEDLSVEEVSRAFDADPNIEYAEPEPVCYPLETPNDPLYNQQQHLPQVMAEEAWAIHKGEDGDEEVVVAIIDTGIDWQHEDMSENCWQNMGEDADGDGVTLEWNGSEWILDPDDLNDLDDDNNGYTDDLIGWDFLDWMQSGNGTNPDPLPTSPSWEHGTHCGSIAAGCTDNNSGVASISWNVKYMPVQVSNGMSLFSWSYDGVVYAAENGADIISNSWGGAPYSQAHAEAIQYAHDLGSIVVCAAGNDWNHTFVYPSAYPKAVCVASLSQNDVKSRYSNYGAWVDVSAPGGGWEGGILAAVPGGSYDWKSGTSMATPLTAGLMALVKSYHPDWSANEVIAQVLFTADNIDSLNLPYAQMLGYGRINAYRALALANVTIPQELELGLISYNLTDQDGNNAFEPGDTISMDIHLRNFNPFVGEDDVMFELQVNDPDLTMLSSAYTADILPDGDVDMDDVFVFVISESTQTHLTTLTLAVESTLPVNSPDDFTFEIAIAPGGILVYDTRELPRDMSGEYMFRFFQELELDVVYTRDLPNSLIGFDAVFVSLENPGTNLDQSNITAWHPDILRKYLIYGGNLYIESGGFFGGLSYLYENYYASMCSYFGVQSLNYPSAINHLNGMSGVNGTMMEDMEFSGSHQLYNYVVEAITPAATGVCPFYESNYGNVAVYREGTNHRAFYLGYSLYELEDTDKTSSRYNMLKKLLEFFQIEEPDAYLVANFKGDNRVGGAPLEVSFSDLTLVNESQEITTWEWDFESDGTFDSSEENPVFLYESPGHYDVTLVVSSESDCDTLIIEDYVNVNQGVLVYEMREGQRNFSGTFIYDFLIENGIEATYTSVLPQSFLGYEAVFLSQGIHSFLNSTTPDVLVPMLIEYFESGGNVYLEGADVLGLDLYFTPDFYPWFGLWAVNDGFYNPLENLTGVEGSLAEGLTFAYSNQTVYGKQDTYSNLPAAQIALRENGLYYVGVQFEGDLHKTFCFSYALAELADGENGTREQLLTAILNFFGFVISGEEEHGNLTSDFRIYPNPVAEKLHIQLAQQWNGMVQCALYTISGRTILNKSVSTGGKDIFAMELDISDLPPGIYFLEVKTDRSSYTKKIIKY